MTKTSNFTWDKEAARALLTEFENFWSQTPEKYGITARPRADTQLKTSRSLFGLMRGHGKRGRKQDLFYGAGDIWEDLVELSQDNLILDDELAEFKFFLRALDKIEGSDRDPRNIVFNTVISFNEKSGEAKRGEVRGHFLTQAYWDFRKNKAEKNDETYDVAKPDSDWVSLQGEKNKAKPPLWAIIFGKTNSLRTLIKEIEELAKEPKNPPIAHLDLKISSGKAGQLANVPAIQAAVRNVLSRADIFPAGKSRAPTKSKLNDAMAEQTIAVSEEVMSLIAPEATVLVENDGRIIRRKLKEFPDFKGIKSVTLNFPRNNIVLNKLIREVLGDEMDSFERPNRAEDGPLGLVLKADEADLIREASSILKRVGFEIRDPEGGEATLGATRYDEDEGVKADVFLANSFRDLREDLDEMGLNFFAIPENIVNQMTPEQREELEDVKFNAIVNAINETVKHESTHWGQLTEPDVKEKTEAMNDRFMAWVIDYIQGGADQNVLLDRLSDIFTEEIYFYIYKEVPAYWIQQEGITWDAARQQVRRAFVFDNPIMKKFEVVQNGIREVTGDENFQLLPNNFDDDLERESIRIFNVAMDSLAERDNNEA